MQKLIGMMAALNRFISQSTDKCRPFFHLLHKWKDFRWTKECVMAFEEVLYAYLAVTDYAISLILVRNEDGI